MLYLTNTFSPMMLHKDSEAEVKEISLDSAKALLTDKLFSSAVGHEVTAKILTTLIGKEVECRRVNLEIIAGRMVCIIPNFRAAVAREFSFKEIADAGYRCFFITITPTVTTEAKLVHEQESDYKFEGEENNGVWITVNNLSVYLKKEHEGIVVDIYPLEQEDGEPITSTWAMWQDGWKPDEEEK
jgi:hypothetical protein